MKAILSICFCALMFTTVQAQEIVLAEYFIDSEGDEGFGSGTFVELTPAEDGTWELPVEISAELAPGFHKLYLRVKDTNGSWSHTVMRNLDVALESVEPEIVEFEYFIDFENEGYGSAVSVPVNPIGDDIEQTITFELSEELDPGFHKMYGRFKDSNGHWSHTFMRNVEIVKNDAASLVFTMEYFFQEDYGFGTASALDLMPGEEDGTWEVVIPIADILEADDAPLSLRVRSTPEQEWSHTVRESEMVICVTDSEIGSFEVETACAGQEVWFEHSENSSGVTYTWDVNSDGFFDIVLGDIENDGSSFGYNFMNQQPDTVFYQVEIDDCPDNTYTDFVVLDFIEVSDSVVVDAFELTAFQDNASYQWLDCENGFEPIFGENAQSFTAVEDGSYAVELSFNGCIVQSECQQIIGTDVSAIDAMSFAVFPNPTNGTISFRLSDGFGLPANVSLINGIGQVVERWTMNQSGMSLELNHSPGVYMIQVENDQTTHSERLILTR